MFRKTIFWVHLSVGVLGAVVILMMSLTGVILTYEAQFNRWALRDYRAAPGAHSPLRVDELLTRAAAGDPEFAPSAVVLRSDPREPAALSLGRGSYLYVDRYTGEILGDGNGRMKRFLRSVMYWHRWFALTGENRAVGRSVTGAANLGFLFLVLSGFYLWWPRRLSWDALKRVMWFRRGLEGKARDFNWHNVIGFWSAIPLFIVVLTGATISYRWAGNLLYTVVGESPPTANRSRTEPKATDVGAESADVEAVELVAYDELIRRAAREIPDWKILTLRLPDSDHEPVTISVDVGSGRQPSKRTDYLLDRANCEVLQVGGYAAYTRGRKLRSWARFAHTGEVYGVIGQTIAGIVSAGGAFLVWTGLALAWRRLIPWPRKPGALPRMAGPA